MPPEAEGGEVLPPPENRGPGFIIRTPEPHGEFGDYENGFSFYDANGTYMCVPPRADRYDENPQILGDEWEAIGFVEES